VLLFAHVPIEGVGRDDRGEDLEEHARSFLMVLLRVVPRPSRRLELTPQTTVVSAQAPNSPLRPNAVRDRTIALARAPLKLVVQCSPRPLDGHEADLRRVHLVASIAVDGAADEHSDDHEADGSEQPGHDRARLFPQPTHQTSCSATARPSCLIAMRVGRRSASRV